MTGAGPEAERTADPAPLRLPDPRALFEFRAARLEALAKGHAAPEWLRFLSRLAAGQALAAREVPPGAARAPGGGPPLAFASLPRDGAWRRMLAVILSAAAGPGLPRDAEDALRRASTLDAAALEALADDVLAGRVGDDRIALAPFAGAALQAWFAALAATIDPSALPPARGACPICGGAPVAAVVQGGDRLRYVTCALCTAEWNVVRVQCVLCGSEKLEYLHAEGDRGAKAEACSACRAYLKTFDQDHRLGVDPAADDAATIALDLLVADEGYHRAGPNLYVAPGVCDVG